jgi:hypothetical protein
MTAPLGEGVSSGVKELKNDEIILLGMYPLSRNTSTTVWETWTLSMRRR